MKRYSKVRTQRRKIKAKQRRPLPWNRIRDLLFKIMPILLLGMLLYFPPRMLKIKQIDCESQFGPCSSALNERLVKLQNKNYVATKNAIKNLLEKQFFVSQFSMKLNLPSTIEVYAIERKAEVAFIKQGKQSEFYLTDGEGIIISQQEQTSLPIVVLKHDYNFVVSEKLPQDLLFAQKLTRELLKAYNSKLVFVDSNLLEVEVSNGQKVIFPLSGEENVLFGSLSLILSRLNSEASNTKIEDVLGITPTTIDLRFKNPVLK